MSALLAPIDVSALLRPGVFLLAYRGRITYIGKAKVLLVALAHHALRNRESLPAWFPIKPIPFDGISIIPCDTTRAVALARALIELHNPIHNRPLKPAHGAPADLDVPPPDTPTRASSSSSFRRI